MIFSKENKKAKELDKLIEKNKLSNNKKFADFYNLLDLLKDLKKQTPEIELKPLYFAPHKKEALRVRLVPKLAISFAVLVLLFSLFSFLPSKEKELSGLNQKAIAKELKIIEENSPTKGLETNQKIKKIFSPSKQKVLDGLKQADIQKEIDSLKIDQTRKQEINDFLNSL